MRQNAKLTDRLILELSNEWFDLKMPIVWHPMKGSDIAEWQNIYLDGLGEYHYIGLNFPLIEDEPDLVDSIMHELIHAEQHEKGLPVNHGVFFCRRCLQFQAFGFNTFSGDCLDKDIDTAKKELYTESIKYFHLKVV